MFYAKFAGLTFQIEHRYEPILTMCQNYFIPPCKPDIVLSVTEEDIRAEQTPREYPLWYLETLAIYRKIAEQLIDYNGFLMHGAVIDVDGTGVAFLAPSGTGKTTHMRLWQDLFLDRLTIINGDKPLIRLENGKLYAYGTPWAGKERLHTNARTELKKIGFLSRGAENVCQELPKTKVLNRLIPQIYVPHDETRTVNLLNLLGTVLGITDFYAFSCNMNPDAAKTVASGMGILK